MRIYGEFYYDRATGQEIPTKIYDKLLKKLGPERTAEYVQTLTFPSIKQEDPCTNSTSGGKPTETTR